MIEKGTEEAQRTWGLRGDECARKAVGDIKCDGGWLLRMTRVDLYDWVGLEGRLNAQAVQLV